MISLLHSFENSLLQIGASEFFEETIIVQGLGKIYFCSFVIFLPFLMIIQVDLRHEILRQGEVPL